MCQVIQIESHHYEDCVFYVTPSELGSITPASMKKTSLAKAQGIFVSSALVCLGLLLPQPATAENLQSLVANWVISGMRPRPLTNPDCGGENPNFLGVFSQDSIDRDIQTSIRRVCERHRSPRRRSEPLFVNACYGVRNENIDFSNFSDEPYTCYCDLFFCNESHVANLENIVDMAVKLGISE